jgi:hypothetical protein
MEIYVVNKREISLLYYYYLSIINYYRGYQHGERLRFSTTKVNNKLNTMNFVFTRQFLIHKFVYNFGVKIYNEKD